MIKWFKQWREKRLIRKAMEDWATELGMPIREKGAYLFSF